MKKLFISVPIFFVLIIVFPRHAKLITAKQSEILINAEKTRYAAKLAQIRTESYFVKMTGVVA
jgi:hypothetical protein